MCLLEGQYPPLGHRGLLCLDSTRAIVFSPATKSSVVIPTARFHSKMQLFLPDTTSPMSHSPWLYADLPLVGLSPSQPHGVWNLLDGFVAGAFTEDQQSGSGTHQQPPHLQALDGGHSLLGEKQH